MILNPPQMPKVEEQADWVEASCLFGEDNSVFREDLRGVLISSNISGQIPGKRRRSRGNRISDIWRELDWRKNLLGYNYPFKLYDDHIERIGDWSKWLPYSYMLLLSISGFGKNQTEKRVASKASSRPFLRFVSASLKAYLPRSIMFDFPREGLVPREIHPALGFVCERIGEQQHPRPSIRQREKDAGVDLFAWHPLDSRSGKIILLVQSTVEEDWYNSCDKIQLRRWAHIVQFSADPQQALAIPYVCHTDWHFWSRSGGIIFDRLRLSPLFSKTGIDLNKELLKYCVQEIQNLRWYQ